MNFYYDMLTQNMLSDLNKNIELRETQIKLLDSLKNICEKHNLVYWIDFGTLLGAKLYGNFIPWDDDIDISMPLEDYKKFLRVAETELPKDIFLQTTKTDPSYKQYFAKLRDCYSTFLEHHETGEEKYHHGIYIDIFPSMYYPRLPTFFRKILTYVTLKSRENVFVLSKKIPLNYPIYVICKICWFLLLPLKGKFIAQVPEDNGYLYIIPENYLYPLREIFFVNKFYPAPNKPHEYLSVLYKEYSLDPPQEKRVSHAKKILINTPCKHPRALINNLKQS